MIYEKIFLDVPNEGEPVLLTAYLPENSDQIDPDRTRKTVILCPGGGYRFVSDREAEPVALQLLAADINVFILTYNVFTKEQFPQQQLELARAIQYVKENAQRYHVKDGKVIVMGFSAGGHLACCLGTMYNDPILTKPLNASPEDIRPDGMVLSYPVITAGQFAHEDSFRRLFGTEDRSVWEQGSLEKRVHPGTPPTFLWTTYEDALVPMENTLLLANALRKNGVSMELHIFPHGPHGLSINTPNVYGPKVQSVSFTAPEINVWLSLAQRWIDEL